MEARLGRCDAAGRQGRQAGSAGSEVEAVEEEGGVRANAGTVRAMRCEWCVSGVESR